MTKTSYVFLLIFSLTTFPSMAQGTSSKVLARNQGIINGNQTVSIKWYSKDLIYPEGVNIYRKEKNGDWIKLNNSPIKKLDSLPQSEFAKDQDLHFFVAYMNASKEKLSGLMFINVLVKSFESESFSKFIGIQYDDHSVQEGKTYTYKVNRIQGKTETLIAESLPLITGKESIVDPVKGFVVFADTNKTKIKWTPEEQRFFAVNIYRTYNNKEVKINQRPLMISKYRDTLGNLQYPKIFFTDDSLAEGFYTYQISGLDFFGRESKRSELVTIEIKDLIPPSPVSALKDSVDNLDVFLKWTNPISKDVAGVNVYRSVNSIGPFAKVNRDILSSTASTYIDKVDHPGPYYYYVATLDKSGNEGISPITFAEVYDIIPPAKPIGLIAKADTGKIFLSWKKNSESDIVGYLIYRTSNKNDKNNFVLMNAKPISAPSFTDKLPRNAKNNFFYKIIAIDSSYNKSEYSEVVSAQMPDIIAPVKPLIKNIYAKDKKIVIEWLANKDADLLGYNIFRGTSLENFSKLNSNVISKDQLQYSDSNIESGMNYFYYVVSVDSAGNQSQASNIQKGFNNFNTLQSSPQEVKLKYRKDKKDIQISWKQETSEGLLGFVIYRKENESGQMIPLSGQVDKMEYIDKEIREGKEYFYQIRAYDQSGTILKSEIKSISIKE